MVHCFEVISFVDRPVTSSPCGGEGADLYNSSGCRHIVSAARGGGWPRAFTKHTHVCFKSTSFTHIWSWRRAPNGVMGYVACISHQSREAPRGGVSQFALSVTVSLSPLSAHLSLLPLASRLESSLSLRSFLFPLASGGHWAGRTPLSYQRVRTNPGQRDCSREPFSTDSGTWSTLIVPMPAGGARWSLCRGCALAPVRVRVVVCRASVRVRVGQQQLTTDGPKPTFR